VHRPRPQEQCHQRELALTGGDHEPVPRRPEADGRPVRAGQALEDDVSVAEGDGNEIRQAPFRRSEVLGPLERWFFGRR